MADMINKKTFISDAYGIEKAPLKKQEQFHLADYAKDVVSK